MSNALRFVKIAIEVFLLAVLVTLIITAYNSGYRAFNNQLSKFRNLTKDADVASLGQFNDTQMSGDIVTSIITRYRSKVPVLVYTGVKSIAPGSKSSDGKFFNTSQIQNPQSDCYINPKKIYTFHFNKNTEGNIDILIFIPVGLTKEQLGIPADQDITFVDSDTLKKAREETFAAKDAQDIATYEAKISKQRYKLQKDIEKWAELQYFTSKDIEALSNIGTQDVTSINNDTSKLLMDIDNKIYR